MKKIKIKNNKKKNPDNPHKSNKQFQNNEKIIVVHELYTTEQITTMSRFQI